MSLADQLKASTPRVLTLDIERIPGLARVWEPRTRFVPIDNFVHYPRLVSFAAKWYHEKHTTFFGAWDTDLAEASWKLYDEADIVVTYNGKRFDNKHLRSEWLTAGLAPPRPWKDVDLYQINAATFGFESKSLAHLCERLGIEGKAGKYDAQTAEDAWWGDAKAQAKLQRYNVRDVKITERAYDALRGWMPRHPAVVIDGQPRCNQCGSDKLQPNGYTTALTRMYPLFVCDNCGANVRATGSTASVPITGAA